MRLLLLGFDAMSYEILEELPGKWTEIGKLRSEGVYGKLQAEVAQTGPSWMTIYTGVSFRKHGVTNTWGLDSDGTSRTILTSPADPFWRHLAKEGITVSLINLPITYPPEPVSGFMVSGWPAPRIHTYPASLGKQLPSDYVVDYINTVEHSSQPMKVNWLTRDEAATLEVTAKMERCRAEVAISLAKRYMPDLLFIQFAILDRLGHYVEMSRAQGRDASSLILNGYEVVDELIATIRGSLEHDAVMIVSDHGWKWRPNEKYYHSKAGVFFAVGDGFRKGNVVQGMRTVDVAPVIFAALDLPLPGGLDGRVLPGVLEEPVYTEEEKRCLEAHLRAMGYLT